MTLRRRLASVCLVAASAAAAFAQGQAAGQNPAKAASENLNLRFANGIVAVAEEKIITVADVVREVAPLRRGVQEGARSEKEYNERVEQLYDSAIQDLIDRVLI